MSQVSQIKTRRSRDQWSQLMADYEASSLTQREFCEHRQLAYSTFCYWRKRLSADTGSMRLSEPLVELPVLPMHEPAHWRLELELGQGVVLRVR